MPEENLLYIKDQEGVQTLPLVKGGYCAEDGRITISIETENADSDGWPPCALFCIYKCPMNGELAVGNTFECNGGISAEYVAGAVQARAYFSFHAESVYVKWTVIEIRSDDVLFRLDAAHDDPRYYDERARECPTSGIFALSKKPRNELWCAV